MQLSKKQIGEDINRALHKGFKGHVEMDTLHKMSREDIIQIHFLVLSIFEPGDGGPDYLRT